MKRSTASILTTHVGSLPAPGGLDPHAPDYEQRLRIAVANIVRRQANAGIDIVNDGELSKGHWLAYLDSRLGGFEQKAVPDSFLPVMLQGKDRADFPGYYEEASRLGTLFYSSGYQTSSPSSSPTRSVCTAPIVYTGQKLVSRDVENLTRAIDEVAVREAFLPVTAVASIEPYRFNEYYSTETQFVYALARSEERRVGKEC